MPRFTYEPFEVLDMIALPQRQVRISVRLSPHLQMDDELDLTPYGVWRVVAVERDPSPEVTTIVAVHISP